MTGQRYGSPSRDSNRKRSTGVSGGCTKKKYGNRETALAVIESFKTNKSRRFRHVKARRVYLCPGCGYWHITSQAKRGKP